VTQYDALPDDVNLARDLLSREFGTVSDLIHAHARRRPEHLALVQEGGGSIDRREFPYAILDQWADRIAAALQRDGIRARDTVAVCAATQIEFVALFVGALRAGAAVAPLAMASHPRTLAAMVADAGAKKLFLDRAAADQLKTLSHSVAAPIVVIDDPGPAGLQQWMAPAGSVPLRSDVTPDSPFNIIYSSGTTGVPKGIVQPHALRWSNIQRAAMSGYGFESVTLLATPLYSNTTLVTLFGALALGGTVVLMGRFTAPGYLYLAQQKRATHTVLVPAQYQRLLAEENFDAFDLSAFRMKFSTGAPFPAALKEQVVRRWPGGLIEIYGMTEGGGACMLEAHKHPTKLHTVGTPLPQHEIRLIDDAGREVAAGETGEIVGRSPAMMSAYLNQPQATAAAQWQDALGRRFIRSGDIGRMDGDGFLVLLDRKKDMIISGGFNVYPSDLESVLREHPAVFDAAVVGVASARWGETPMAFVVLKKGATPDAAELTLWANARVEKVQRLAGVKIMPELPRNAAGKVLKRELRDSLAAISACSAIPPD
jgi:acyl-CoA synthetase (AMP-forming)/AMP-acid ligase II